MDELSLQDHTESSQYLGLGLLFLVVSLFFYLIPTGKTLTRGALQWVEGDVIRTERFCNRGICTFWIDLQTASGELQMSQNDIFNAGNVLPPAGTRVSALVQRYSFAARVPGTSYRTSARFWEFRVGDRPLLVYELPALNYANKSSSNFALMIALAIVGIGFIAWAFVVPWRTRWEIRRIKRENRINHAQDAARDDRFKPRSNRFEHADRWRE